MPIEADYLFCCGVTPTEGRGHNAVLETRVLDDWASPLDTESLPGMKSTYRSVHWLCRVCHEEYLQICTPSLEYLRVCRSWRVPTDLYVVSVVCVMKSTYRSVRHGEYLQICTSSLSCVSWRVPTGLYAVFVVCGVNSTYRCERRFCCVWRE